MDHWTPDAEARANAAHTAAQEAARTYYRCLVVDAENAYRAAAESYRGSLDPDECAFRWRAATRAVFALYHMICANGALGLGEYKMFITNAAAETHKECAYVTSIYDSMGVYGDGGDDVIHAYVAADDAFGVLSRLCEVAAKYVPGLA